MGQSTLDPPCVVRTGGKKQVLDIIEAIKSSLHDQPVMLEDH